MENTRLKPVVWVANPDDKKFIDEYSNTNEYKSLVDSVITPMDVAELQKQGYTFPDNIENTILCIDPRGEKKYIYRTEQTDRDAIVWRLMNYELILQLLGGEHFEIVHKISCASEIDKKTGVNVGGRYQDDNVDGSGEVKVATSNDKKESSAEELEETGEWKEATYNLEEYMEAVKLARETGLDSEPNIHKFLMARNPARLNTIKRDTYKYNVCSDLKVARDVCVDVKAKVAELFSLNVNVDTSCNESVQNNEIFEYKISWGKFVGDKPTPIEMEKVLKSHSSNKWLIILIAVLLIALMAVLTLFFLK